MEVDNVLAGKSDLLSKPDPEWINRTRTLNRAIETVTSATEHDMDGLYEDAVKLYDTALSDFNAFVCTEKSQVVRDCMVPKMDAYACRSDTLKKFLRRSRSPSGGSLTAGDGDPTETSASSDSGVETADDLGTGHNLSSDSGAEECDYATIDEPRKHQQQSRQQFLDACAEQVEQLLHIIKDQDESEEIRQTARHRCLQILDFAESYRRDFCPSSEPPQVARTVSVASSVAADPALTRQLVHAEVLLSAADGDDCPEPPADGDAEFKPLTFSIDSLRFADADSRRSDSPDYATVRRATPSPRKHLSQASLNKIEPDCEPLLSGLEPRVELLPASTQRRPNRWWRRNKQGEHPEPMDRQLSEPGLFWVLLGSICG